MILFGYKSLQNELWDLFKFRVSIFLAILGVAVYLTVLRNELESNGIQ